MEKVSWKIGNWDVLAMRGGSRRKSKRIIKGGGGDLRCFSCERKKRKTNGEAEKNRKEIFLASNKYSIIFEFIEVTITL